MKQNIHITHKINNHNEDVSTYWRNLVISWQNLKKSDDKPSFLSQRKQFICTMTDNQSPQSTTGINRSARHQQGVEDHIVIMAICIVISSFCVSIFIAHINHWHTLVRYISLCSQMMQKRRKMKQNAGKIYKVTLLTSHG